MPEISIITPVYNAARWLPETIASVQAQTHTDWEWILVDDASADESVELIKTAQRQDARLQIICQPRNGGPALARRAALAASSGRYLAFLDADDLWLPEKLSLQKAFMQQQQAALSHTGYERFDATAMQPPRRMVPPALLTYEQCLGNTAIACSTVMLDLQQCGSIEIADHPVDDFILWLSILRRGHVAMGMPQILARYRVLPRSWSGNVFKNAARVWDIYRQHEKLSVLRAAPHWARYAFNAVWRRFGFMP